MPRGGLFQQGDENKFVNLVCDGCMLAKREKNLLSLAIHLENHQVFVLLIFLLRGRFVLRLQSNFGK